MHVIRSSYLHILCTSITSCTLFACPAGSSGSGCTVSDGLGRTAVARMWMENDKTRGKNHFLFVIFLIVKHYICAAVETGRQFLQFPLSTLGKM